MKKTNFTPDSLRPFLCLWSTQTLSGIGSSMTSFALVIWAYQNSGSALSTALLSVCSYAPYVLLSIFAGALSDRWNKKTVMLVCDAFAACSTVAVLLLLLTNRLCVSHLYVLNAVNGLMNTVQQPASDVAVSLLTPKRHTQRVGGLRSFSYSLNSLFTPVLATAVYSFFGITAVIAVDLLTFLLAFCTLLFAVPVPKITQDEAAPPVLRAAREGLRYLKQNRGILDLILFLAAINLTASVYNAALPALLLSRAAGGETVLGAVNAAAGAAMLIGSLLVSVLPAPKSRVRVICNALFISMSTENFFLAFGQTGTVWCIGAALGWLCVPVMNANMDVLFRTKIPLSMQGRGVIVPDSRRFGHFNLPAFPPQPTHLGAGKRIVYKKERFQKGALF